MPLANTPGLSVWCLSFRLVKGHASAFSPVSGQPATCGTLVVRSSQRAKVRLLRGVGGQFKARTRARTARGPQTARGRVELRSRVLLRPRRPGRGGRWRSRSFGWKKPAEKAKLGSDESAQVGLMWIARRLRLSRAWQTPLEPKHNYKGNTEKHEITPTVRNTGCRNIGELASRRFDSHFKCAVFKTVND